MKISAPKRIFVASSFAIFSAASFSMFSISQQTNNICACPSQYEKIDLSTVQQCKLNNAANKSWVSWLTGNSRSSQFHYLDLLELLSSPSDDNAKQIYSNPIK